MSPAVLRPTPPARTVPKASARSVIGALFIMTAVMATTAAMAVAAQASSRTPPTSVPIEAGPSEGDQTEDGGSEVTAPPCVPAPPPEISYSVADGLPDEAGDPADPAQPAEPEPCPEESLPPATTAPPPITVKAVDDTIDAFQDQALDPFDVTENDVILPALGAIEVVSGTMPDGLTLWLDNSLEGWVIGTPTECGSFTLDYKITAVSSAAAGDTGDGSTDTATITVDVNCASAPAPIEAVDDTLGATVGERLEVDIVENDTLAAAITRIELEEAGALPAGLSLWAGGWLTGTPTESGNFTFQYQAIGDGGSTSFGTVELTIRQAED